MSFIVQISPFVYLFMLKIVFRYPHQGSALDLLRALSVSGPQKKKAIFWSVTVYNKNLSIQCHLSALIEQGQDKQFYM
jgi:hypothetical protein